MESGIDPGQDYYTQEYCNYDRGYDLPRYGSRRKLISPSGLYDEYGEVVVDDDGSYYYSPHVSEAEHGSRKRRIKLVLDREYETSSAGDDSAPEALRGRSAATFNHADVNGGLYVAQNGSVVRTRRPPSPAFSSRLAKHFKKVDKMAATPEEKLALNSAGPAAVGVVKSLRAFESSGPAGPASPSFANSDIHKTVNVFDTRQSSISSDCASTGRPSYADGGTDGGLRNGTSDDREPGEGERESGADGSNGEGDRGPVMRDVPGCPSERTQSDEDELWMGPWNNLHIPMTKL